MVWDISEIASCLVGYEFWIVFETALGVKISMDITIQSCIQDNDEKWEAYFEKKWTTGTCTIKVKYKRIWMLMIHWKLIHAV